MTPLQFETAHAAQWSELEPLAPPPVGKAKKLPRKEIDRARLAALYRLACEHLAVAEARAYPVWLIERLASLTARAHQRIYRQADLGALSLGRLFLIDFPAAVRAHRWHVLIAFLIFVGPMLVVGVLSYLDPGFILSVHDAATVDSYDRMYGDGSGPIGRRTAASDWKMFGVYIRNNIGIAFQCFAGGLFLGIGSLFFLAVNGVYAGSVAGYLTWRGHGENFYSFVITHGAFELTGIVLAGAAGLVLGEALLFPAPPTEVQALKAAAGRAIVIMYGTTAFFVVAAGLEAFWSSARWVDPPVKYAVGGFCWLLVLAYLGLQGRPRSLLTPVKVDAITLDLRPRTMFEAADLGVRMAGAHARSVWPTVWPVFVLVVVLAGLTWPYGAVWPIVVVFWLKPWYDRSILFVLARAAFGEPTRFVDLLAAGRSVWWSGLWSSLTMRRLSPWRSYVQPVLQLEGQHGKERRARMARILGSHRGSALAMQWAFATVEFVIALGLSILPAWLVPADESGNLVASLFADATGWHAVVNTLCYPLTVFILEPFFVGAGFAMYLNRRVELEAWDIEQEFRLAFAT